VDFRKLTRVIYVGKNEVKTIPNIIKKMSSIMHMLQSSTLPFQTPPVIAELSYKPFNLATLPETGFEPVFGASRIVGVWLLLE
jgi:hypothetical protein